MGTKVAIILLVIIALLFVGFQVWGSSNHGSSSKDDKSTASSFNADDYPVLGWFKQAAGPKLDPKQIQPLDPKQLQPPNKFDLSKQATYAVRILPDRDHQFRQAKVKIQSPSSGPCAYTIFTPLGAEGDLKTPQCSDHTQQGCPDKPQNTNPTDFGITIPKGGGNLVAARKSPLSTAACVVTLQ